jgi:hypothetical protein
MITSIKINNNFHGRFIIQISNNKINNIKVVQKYNIKHFIKINNLYNQYIPINSTNM